MGASLPSYSPCFPIRELNLKVVIPRDLEKEVNADIGLLRMTGNIGELFVTNMGNTACRMLGFGMESEKEKNKCDFLDGPES